LFPNLSQLPLMMLIVAASVDRGLPSALQHN
jgi:hypothetical protein